MRQFSDVQADNDVLQEENERLFAKLESAAKYIADSDSIRSGLLTERKQLADERNKAVARVKENQGQLGGDRTCHRREQAAERPSSHEISQKMVSKSEFEKLAAEKKVLTAKLSEKMPPPTLSRRRIAQIAASAKRLEYGK